MEGWLSYSIYVSAAVLLLSLVGCLPQLIFSFLSWLQPAGEAYRFGAARAAEPASAFTLLCEALMTISGAWLLLASLIQSSGRRRQW